MSVKQTVDRSPAALATLWPKILVRLRADRDDKAVAMWLDPAKVRPLACDDGVLVLECPTAVFSFAIQGRLAPRLLAAAGELLATPLRSVRCQVSGVALRDHERLKQEAEHAVEQPVRPLRGCGQGFKLLEHFVVGSANRLAYDAVMQILDRPQDAPNPLFIHGKSGLGKTHLEQGLYLAFRERHPRRKVEYLRCEKFTNDFIEACNGGPGAIQAFRVRMRHPDLLLIDDLHWLSQIQGDKTKRELFQTFNELAEQGKRVVVTSDAGPRAIQYLEEAFVQRFSGGLVVELQKPDPPLRAEVIRAKATALELRLGDEVVDFVSDHITDNIRELEGAVNKLAQFARSFGRRIDLAAARQALGDLLGRRGDEPLADLVLREVADHFGAEVRELTGRRRTGPLPLARHVAMYLLKLAGSDGYDRVGRLFGVGHTAVIYACNQVAKRRAADPELDRFITDLLFRTKRG